VRLRQVLLPALVGGLVADVGTAQSLLSTGTGFLVNDTGWILTNRHVVEDCDFMEVEGFGRATTIIKDSQADLALVLLRGQHQGAPLPLRETPPRLTEDLVALGYPLSDVLGNNIRATTGTVSALGGVHGDPRYLQISAPIQPGNSGGPVLDADGSVIGIASASLSDQVYDASQNVNFAITASEATRFMNESGISFTSAADASNALDGAAGVDAASTSVYLLQCLADTVPVAPAPAPAPQVSSAARPPSGSYSAMISYDGMDVLGFDYRTLRDVSLNTCQASCEGDPVCRAYTFNTRYDACFLKSDASVLVENGIAVGGFDRDLADDVIDSGLTMSSDVDSPGGDYRRIRGSDYIQCTLECGIDSACVAFAYVRRTNDCWLKSWVGQVESMPGVEFGLKR
jgi:serine protease Do